MPMSILQQFLNLQFIKTDEAGAVENLEKVVSRLIRQLPKQKHKIIAYTLAAIDPDIQDDDPVIQEVEEFIFTQWRTFKNSTLRTQDRPVTYVRAVILEALAKLAEDLNFAAIIWHSGRNLIGRYSLGREKDVIGAFLMGIGEKVFSESKDYWSGRPSIDLPEISITKPEIPDVTSAVINAEDIQKHLKAAFVYSRWANEAGGGENPHQHGQNDWQWPKFASEKAAKGLAEEINKAVAKQDGHINKTTRSIATSISSLPKNLQTFSQSLTESMQQGFEGNERRSKLLWWKESLYSQALRKGYRTLPELEAIFAMAIDYSHLVSPIYPESIDYFLTETLRDLIGDKAYAMVPFQELVGEFGSLSEGSRKMLELFSTESEGRVLLGSAIFVGGFKANVQATEFLSLCGVNKSFELSRAEFLLWLFHDAQALNLASQK